MNRRIAAWSAGDLGKAGLSSVLRVPGTANYKRHPQVDSVRLELTGVPAWSPEVLEQSIPLLPEPTTAKKPPNGTYTGPRRNLLDYLEAADLEVLGSVSDDGGSKFAVLCPWVDEHSGGDRSGTFVGQFENGATWFHCHHEHCQGRAWRDFKEKVSMFTTIRVTRPGYTGPALEVVVSRG
jgi:hypothetical protein